MNEPRVKVGSRSAGNTKSAARLSRRIFEIGLALVIGIMGGAVFWSLGLPLPWMLGAMFFSMLAALLRVPTALPLIVRKPTLMVIGVMLGATIRPEFFAAAGLWWPSFLAMAILLVIAASINVIYLNRIGGIDRTTALFAGIPGGLAEMIALGSQRGGDAAIIALLHSARIFFVVFSFSFLLDTVATVEASGADSRTALTDTSLTDLAWLAFCMVAGVHVARWLKLPARVLVGPMLISAVVHMAGATHFEPPIEIVSGAQVVLGASIGLSFAGWALRDVARVLLISLGSVALLMSLTAIAAVLVGSLTDLRWAQLMLAYAPGGLAEMSIVALALGLDVSFVAVHHVARISFVVLCAPLAERWLREPKTELGGEP